MPICGTPPEESPDEPADEPAEARSSDSVETDAVACPWRATAPAASTAAAAAPRESLAGKRIFDWHKLSYRTHTFHIAGSVCSPAERKILT